MNYIKRSLYILWQCSWGGVQSLFGLVVLLLLGRRKHRFYRCALLTEYEKGTQPKCLKNLGCVSLGMFIFVGVETKRLDEPLYVERIKDVTAHEYGHTFQSLVLGPLYLPIVGLPSLIWCRHYGKHRQSYTKRGISYTSRFPEKQAQAYGERIKGRGF